MPHPQPLPPKRPEPTAPVTPQQRQQIQQGVQQQRQQDTEQARRQLPPQVQIPQGGYAHANPDTHTVVIKSPQGGTQVVDQNSGKPVLSYTPEHGRPNLRPDQGVTRQQNGPVIVEKGPAGYQRTFDPQRGVDQTSYRGWHQNSVTINNTTVINQTVVVNNQTYIINQNRTYIRQYNPYHGDYVRDYRPQWWGQPQHMDDNWMAGRHHCYGEFYAYGGYNPAGYRSPWWRPENRFERWEEHPYEWHDWDRYHTQWGWGWYREGYYRGYYEPRHEYRHFGWWIADYWLQRELETERLERRAAEEYAEYVAEEQREWIDNARAIEQVDEPVAEWVLEQLATQVEQMVQSIRLGTTLYASNLINDGHIFVVDTTTKETATIDGVDYTCRLRPGDLVQRNDALSLDVEVQYNADGTPQVDEYGNVITVTYVPMTVVASKRHSCARGSAVVMQLDALQNMVSEERARVQEGMEYGVTIGIHP